MHSVALQVESLEATMAHLQQEEVRIAARPRPEMCFSDPGDTGGIFFQWSSFELPVDPRFGAPPPDPLPAGRVLAPATHHAFVGALVDDPLNRAQDFARLLGTAVTFADADAPPGHPAAGVALGDCALALFPLPGDEGHALRGRPSSGRVPISWPSASEDLGAATDTLHAAGITIVRWAGGLVVLDPAATGGVQIALTGTLLPGDHVSDHQGAPKPAATASPSARRRHSHHRTVELGPAFGPEEAGVAEGEDSAVGRHEPVAVAIGIRRHADDGLVQAGAAFGPEEAGVAEGEDPAVGRPSQ